MPVIKNLQIIETAVGRWKPSDIAFISEVSFLGQGAEGGGSALSLGCLLQRRDSVAAGWPDPSSAFWLAEFAFTGVREFALKQSGSGHIQVQGFDIIDHSADQLEGIRLEVQDYEDGVISFWARTAEVVSCAPSPLSPVTSPFSRVFDGPFKG